MTRGDQRERDRARAQARKAKQPKKNEKGKHGGETLNKKKQTDAEIMREKQKKAEERKAAENAKKK